MLRTLPEMGMSGLGRADVHYCPVFGPEPKLRSSDDKGGLMLSNAICPGTNKKHIRTRPCDTRTIQSKNSGSVASILTRDVGVTIQNWLELVKQDAELTRISLSRDERSGHLLNFLRDLILRLRENSELASPISVAARHHGEVRCQQGYTASMLVDESRFLEVSVYSTLQRNFRSVDLGRVLLDVVTIADEVDSQLKQSMLAYGTTTATIDSRTEELAG
jgi:hypothetical protein